MIAERTRVSRAWLDLREPADAAAREPGLVEELRHHLPSRDHVIHDLGSGTGSMARWLAPLLPGRQHWVLHDMDEELLEVAVAELPGRAADGAPIVVETRRSDVTALGHSDLAGATLITASALLDLLTEEELEGLIETCAHAGCPALLSLSVVGRVELAPADPLDVRVAAAFDAHQRRRTLRGRLLGPDAVAAAAEGFRLRRSEVHIEPTRWRLGPEEADLAAAWFIGWIGAACEQSRDLAAGAGRYARRRLAEIRAGRLAITVGHADLLVVP